MTTPFFLFDAPSVRDVALAAQRAELDPIRIVEAVSSGRRSIEIEMGLALCWCLRHPGSATDIWLRPDQHDERFGSGPNWWIWRSR
jgi:hypothetical protein